MVPTTPPALPPLGDEPARPLGTALFQEFLRELYATSDWNDDTLGDAARVPARSIASYRDGGAAPRSDVVFRLSEALQLPVDAFRLPDELTKRARSIGPAEPCTIRGLDTRKANIEILMDARGFDTEALIGAVTAKIIQDRAAAGPDHRIAGFPYATLKRMLTGYPVDSINYERVADALGVALSVLDRPLPPPAPEPEPAPEPVLAQTGSTAADDVEHSEAALPGPDMGAAPEGAINSTSPVMAPAFPAGSEEPELPIEAAAHQAQGPVSLVSPLPPAEQIADGITLFRMAPIPGSTKIQLGFAADVTIDLDVANTIMRYLGQTGASIRFAIP